ncbi:left-right determination factor 2-like [Tachyglossus aculeatus]|uniref:left-right determination factor 2-like n=1 Tax=Tachyglossus aculeatus TaxID=9261 RepID=UPI0018F3C92F|nr:left-right determination factor 2-like [Tachyglossus aculeatus]
MNTAWLSCALGALFLAYARTHHTEKLQKSLREGAAQWEADPRRAVVVPNALKDEYVGLVKQYWERRALARRRKRNVAENSENIAEISGSFLHTATFNQLLVFNLTAQIPPDSEVSQATIKLFQKPSPKAALGQVLQLHPGSSFSHARVTVYWLHLHVDGANRTSLIDSRQVAIGHSGWVTFDVTEAVHHWQQQGLADEPLVLEISVHGDSASHMSTDLTEVIRFASQDPLDNPLQKPQLELQTLDLRSYGTSEDCNSANDSNSTHCCRQKKYINLAEMHWDDHWILHPPGFEASECVGGCQRLPGSLPRLSSWHCVPTETSSVPVLYVIQAPDSEGIQVVLGKLLDMRVEKCTCRRR